MQRNVGGDEGSVRGGMEKCGGVWGQARGAWGKFGRDVGKYVGV